MYNLKNGKGTYKGLIGECLFKLTKRYLIVTKFFNKNKYFSIFGDKLTDIEKSFLEKNWFSIDALEFDYAVKPRRIVLYEIKTCNKYADPKPYWKQKMTLATHDMYTEASKIGFVVRLATVWLLDNWDYDIEISDFIDSDYYIDKPKKYDK